MYLHRYIDILGMLLSHTEARRAPCCNSPATKGPAIHIYPRNRNFLRTRFRAARAVPEASSCHAQQNADALRPCRQLPTALLAAVVSGVMVLGPCDHAEAARSGGRIGGHRVTRMAHKRASSSGLGSHLVNSHRHATPARYRVPMSVRLHALQSPFLSAPNPSVAADLVPSARPPLLLGDILAYPDLAVGIDLEALPLWASLLGLAAANVAGLALTIAVLRGLQDSSEPLTVVKVQVAMLERRPQLQSKLRELSSMIQVGQQGAWLILEESILQLLQHQGRIAYASVSCEQLNSKKKAYTVFGELAEAEAAKAKKEEAFVRHIGETTDEDTEDVKMAARTGIFGGLMGGLGLGGGPHGAKELTVVTLILATRGNLRINNKITDWAGLRNALQQVTGLSSDRIMAIELLWTPREESDYLTREQLVRDYPNLVSLMPVEE